MDLKNKTVLITGAARRIGRALAEGFAERGAHVLVHYRNSESEAKELVTALMAKGVRSEAVQADLSSVAAIEALGQRLIRDYERVDVLVNNASTFYPTSLKTLNEAQWDEFIAIHIKAPFFLAQQLGPVMKHKGCGRIINIADWTGLRPQKNYVAYCTTKAALLALTQSLAKELAPEVLVTAVCPGPILAPLGMEAPEQVGIADRTLVKHWGNPADLVKQVVFLAEQDFATGSTHLVDGGQSLL